MRIKSTVNGTTTAFVGTHFEWTGSTSTMVKYYYAGAQRLAMRTGSGSANSGVKWLLGDHLGSTSLTANYDGASPVTQLYKPWGEVRYSSGSLPTKYTYTGQYSNMSDFGLMFYNARWYDPVLGRMAQADTYVPRDSDKLYNPLVTGFFNSNEIENANSESAIVQMFGGSNNLISDEVKERYELDFTPPTLSRSFDRYAYSISNPVNYTDPSGHKSGCHGNSNFGYCNDETTSGWVYLYFEGRTIALNFNTLRANGDTETIDWANKFMDDVDDYVEAEGELFWALTAAGILAAHMLTTDIPFMLLLGLLLIPSFGFSALFGLGWTLKMVIEMVALLVAGGAVVWELLAMKSYFDDGRIWFDAIWKKGNRNFGNLPAQINYP